jgi:hypothetical protein
MRYHPSDNLCINLLRKVDIFELFLGRERDLVQPFKEFILLASGGRNLVSRTSGEIQGGVT